MKFSDTLSLLLPEYIKAGTFETTYTPVIEKVTSVTDTSASTWQVYVDPNQVSTREAGKSSCEFLGANFDTLHQAFNVVACMQEELPDVNLEIHVAPDGRLDQGDGIASYDPQNAYMKGVPYVQDSGFGVSVLVDIQNVRRSMKLSL